MRLIYFFVTRSKEFLNDSFHVYQEYFINQGHLLHSLLITIAIAVAFAILFYFIFGFAAKRMCKPSTWWVLLLMTAIVAFFATGATNGLISYNSQHSLKYILDDKFGKTEPGVPKTEKQKYPQYKAMCDKFAKGMFHVKPVLNMAITNFFLCPLFFWLLSILSRSIIPDSNAAKGSPRYLNNQQR